MSLEKRIKDLELLSLSRQHQKNLNRDYRLQKKGTYEQSEELFEPLIAKQNEVLEQQEKQMEAIKPLLNMKAIKPNLPIELKTNNMGTEQLPKTWMFKQNDKGDLFFNDKLIIIEDGNIQLANSTTSYPFTDNLKALLNGADIDSIDDENDLLNYSNLATEVKSSKQSKRSKALMKKISKMYKGNALQVITVSENPKELWDRLKVLTAASREGHNNNLDEKSAILDKLLQLKQITTKQYKKLL